MSALHESIRANDIAAVRSLLADRAATEALIDTLDDYGETPLFAAVSRRDVAPEIVQMLLEAGANPNFVAVGRPDVTPEMVQTLPEAIADPNFVTTAAFGEESVVGAAIKRGNPEIVRLLSEHGADLGYTDVHGHTAVLDAVYGEGDRLPIVTYLLSLGLDVNGVSRFRETALRQAYATNQLSAVKALLQAGADDGPLEWTALHRAVAVGTPDDVKSVLAQWPDLEARDFTDRTPLQVALRRGDEEIVRILSKGGAPLRRKDPLLCEAVEGRSPDLVRWLVVEGAELESENWYEQTPLQLAVSNNDFEMAKLLLELGANPNAHRPHSPPVQDATTKEMICLLLDGGADPACLSKENTRILAGFSPEPEPLDRSVTRAEYLAERSPREGRSNPEEMTGPFKLAMLRSGSIAYWAREKFDDPAIASCGLDGRQADPVWCADRFGQTVTLLKDGRAILIAGEHEDYYDPDFCIYNDVFEISPDGSVRIFGYPYSVFPPTDFHTATLVGDDIWIIGSLGYVGTRGGPAPVFRLHLPNFRIERVATDGDDPGWIYRHRARLLDEARIVVEGGTRIRIAQGQEELEQNRDVYVLDLASGRWSTGAPLAAVNLQVRRGSCMPRTGYMPNGLAAVSRISSRRVSSSRSESRLNRTQLFPILAFGRRSGIARPRSLVRRTRRHKRRCSSCGSPGRSGTAPPPARSPMTELVYGKLDSRK
jgi:ankyrin repeat protein